MNAFQQTWGVAWRSTTHPIPIPLRNTERMSTETLTELMKAAEETEAIFLSAVKAERAAIDAAQDALQKATRARIRYMRALGAAYQSEAEEAE